MKFMLMMHTPSGGPYQLASWPPQDIKAHIEFMKGFAGELRHEFVSSRSLQDRVAAQHGFVVTHHRMELFASCLDERCPHRPKG